MSSTPLHPTLPLLAFTPPRVNGQDILFGVRTPLGLTDLVLAPDLARELAQALTTALGSPVPAAPRRHGSGPVPSPDKLVRYLRAWSEHRARLHRSLNAACRAHGVSTGAVYSWLEGRDTATLEALCARHGIKAPLPKPSGKLL